MKGILGFLLAGGLIGFIVLIIVIIFAWYLTATYPILCNFLNRLPTGNPIGGICWWIQLFVIIIIIRKVLPIGK